MLQEKELKLLSLFHWWPQQPYNKALGPVINLKKCSVDNVFPAFNVDMD